MGFCPHYGLDNAKFDPPSGYIKGFMVLAVLVSGMAVLLSFSHLGYYNGWVITLLQL